MLLGIDHVVIACPDPDAAAAELERSVGLRAGGGGRHDALGTWNRLVWLGDTYLELIGVFDRELAEGSWLGVPTVRALDAGGGLATWAVATDAIERDVTRLTGTGSGLAPPMAGERRRPDGGLVRWRLSAPSELGPDQPPFLIEHDPAGAEWTPADRAARARELHPIGGPVRLDTIELETTDMVGTISVLMRTAGIGPFRPSLAGGGARDAAVGAQTIRLRAMPGRDSFRSAATLHLRVGGPAFEAGTVEAVGCRFILRV